MQKVWATSVAVVIVLFFVSAGAQNSRAALDAAAHAMGASDLNSIQYAGTGSAFGFGQAYTPGGAWPRFNAQLTVAINYQTPALRQELVRTQAEKPPRGGAAQPFAVEQRAVQVVSGRYAWAEAGTSANPQLGAVSDRLRQLWITPHGLIKAALTNGAQVTTEKNGVKSFSLKVEGQDVKVTLNNQNLVQRVEYMIDNPVTGDTPVETTYSQYADYGGVKFPTHIVEKQDGFPTLDITVRDVKPNAAVSLEPPANVRQAPPPPPTPPAPAVQTQQLADGVWYLMSNYNSTAVEFKDFIVVFEGANNEARSIAVNNEVRKLVPGKPIKYLINSHHHFDHSGGLRAYAADGVTIITHEVNRPYYEKVWARPHTLNPDLLAKSPRKAVLETMTEKKVLTDGTRTMDLYHLQGSGHASGLIMAYLPKERILIYADQYNPPAGNDPRDPNTTAEYRQNLYDNIQRLTLDPVQMASVHGRVVPLDNLKKALGLIPATSQ